MFNFSLVPDLLPPFGSEEQPANPLELRRLVSLPTILTPRQDGEHYRLIRKISGSGTRRAGGGGF